MSVYELEMQRVKKERPDLSIEKVELLERLLAVFRESSHYEMLHGVHLAQFVEDPAVLGEGFGQMTFGHFASEGAAILVLDRQMSGDTLDQMIAVFERFVGFMLHEDFQRSSEELTDFDIEPDSRRDEIIVRNRQRRPTREIAVLSSVEVAKRLEHLFTALKHASGFATISQHKLSQYWETETMRAPFLEELSLRELCHLSVDTLLKKRSVTPQKAVLLIEALERIASSLTLKDSLSDVSSDQAVRRPQSAQRFADQSIYEWRGESLFHDEFEIEEIALLFSWLAERSWLQQHHTPFECLLHHLPDVLTPQEFLAAFAKRKELLPIFRQKTIEFLERELTEAFQGWSEQLRQPGVKEKQLFSAYRSAGLSDLSYRIVCSVVLQALGAVQPSAHGVVFRSVWTSSPEALTRILKMIRGAQDRTISLEDLIVLLPNFDREELSLLVQKMSE